MLVDEAAGRVVVVDGQLRARQLATRCRKDGDGAPRRHAVTTMVRPPYELGERVPMVIAPESGEVIPRVFAGFSTPSPASGDSSPASGISCSSGNVCVSDCPIAAPLVPSPRRASRLR